MPYANSWDSRREKRCWSSREFSGPALMPPEPLPPWDRKGGEFFRERRNGYASGGGGGGGGGGHGYDHGHSFHHNNVGGGSGGNGGGGGGGGRWRDSSSSPFASGSRNSNEFSPRWGFPSEFRRPPGHIKQGGWHTYQEDSHQGYQTPRSGDRFMDDECIRPSGPRGDGRYGRFYRDNRNGFGQKEWRGHHWENNHQHNGPANTPGRPHSLSSQRSVADSPARPSQPVSDPGTQVPSKDPVDKTSEDNGSVLTPKIVKENSLGSLDWKPLKWSRSGSLTSRGSGFSHSSSSKSMGEEPNDVVGDLAPRNLTPVRSSPSGDAAACEPSTALPEEASSRKKARLGWGEGLAKYEKKKVDGPEENPSKTENTTSAGNAEPTRSVTSTLADKSPKVMGFSDCSSPATPSSFACSSSPGLEKSYGKTTDGDPNNFSVSSVPVLENPPEGMQFSLEKLELNSIANLSSLLSQLLQVDDQCSMDSGFMRSSAFNKLVLWKGDISKALELTETEIDSLENELKSLKADCDKGVPCPVLSNVLPIDSNHHGLSDGMNGFTRPLPVVIESSEDTNVEKTLPNHYAREAHAESKDVEIDSPGSATSKFVEAPSCQRPVSPCEWKNPCSADNGFAKSSETVPENLFSCDIEAITDGKSCQGDDAKAIPGVCSKNKDDICDIIFTSNKDISAEASDVFTKLLPTVTSDINVNGTETNVFSCLPADTAIKEKFLRRKRSLKFKERVLSLKYRAHHHLWKEDLRLLSSSSHRTKPQKKLDLVSRSMQIGNQKHRLSFRSRVASSAGSLSLVPTTEMLNVASKLLSDSELKMYRSHLKMPAMILDEKEKMSSRFVSTNGLVEDPCAVEKERGLINPWTAKEKEIFLEKLSKFGKDFKQISSFLDHKTVADCVQFYYKCHKSEGFGKTKKQEAKKQRKPLSSDTYMLTSDKKWGREMNSASLDVLGAASVIASQADQAMKTSKSRPKLIKPRVVLEDVAEDERETVAADVLAGICGSLSSEPMTSCITSSVDPTEGNYEWRHRKFSSSIKKPLASDIALNVDVDDDDTCSDESCGEMDPVDWTDDEKSLFIQAFSSHGKDFLMISHFVRTKTRDQCKVFFSKARKCLGLESLHPRSNDTNVAGSDVDDEGACVAETGSDGCSVKSGSRIHEDDVPPVSQDVSKPDSTVADPSTSEGNYGPDLSDCKDVDMEQEISCPADNQADGSDLCPDDAADVRDHKVDETDDDIERAPLVTQDDESEPQAINDCDMVHESPPKVTNDGDGVSASTCENNDNLVSNVLISYTDSRDVNVECKQSAPNRGSAVPNESENGNSKGLDSVRSVKVETNGDITHKPRSESKVQPFQECYFRKCSRSASQSSVVVAELPLLSKSDGRTSSDNEKPCSSGDVKLFGKILCKTSSVDKATSSVQRRDDTGSHNLTPGANHDNNGFVGLENVPVRNYGIWDGNKIKVVSYPPLTESPSALLLAKYPAAFTNGSASSPKIPQTTLQVPSNSGECHLNNACAYSPREFNTGNNQSVIDYPALRNQDTASPFMLDFKQRANIISDPVAALRSHYSSQQYRGGSGGGGVGGKTVNGVVAREETWRGQGDVGR